MVAPKHWSAPNRGIAFVGLLVFAVTACLVFWSFQQRSGTLGRTPEAAALALAKQQVATNLVPVAESLAVVARELSSRGVVTAEQLRTVLYRRENAESSLSPLRRINAVTMAGVLDLLGRPLTIMNPLPPGITDSVTAQSLRDGAPAASVLPLPGPDGRRGELVLGMRLVSAQGTPLGTVVATLPSPAVNDRSNAGLEPWLITTDGTILAGPAKAPGPNALREPTSLPGILVAVDPLIDGPWTITVTDLALLGVLMGMAFLVLALFMQAARLDWQRLRLGDDQPARLSQRATDIERMLDHMDQGVMLISPDRRVEVCNRRALELLQLPADMMAARPPLDDVLSYQWREGVFEHTTNEVRLFLRRGTRHTKPTRYERRTTDGLTIQVLSIPLAGGGMVRTIIDITEQKAAESSLAFVAQHDELTQLANRAAVRDRLEQELKVAAGSAAEIAVMYLDLDRFKLVNDTRGHSVGDALLAQVGNRLRRTVRSGDLVGRIGGDEFAILLLNTRGDAVVNTIATELLHCVAEPYLIDSEASIIGVSIGVALFPVHGTTADDLLRNADSALYRAKHAGRGVVRFFESADDEEDRTRLQLESDLRVALERHQFELAYQPIVDSRTGEPVAFEALIRWRHPERGLVPPAEFIPVAEETGLIGPIGLWVIETACKEAASWKTRARISINLSPVQFRQPNLELQIAAILERTGLPAARLDLEVTEGVLLARTEAVRRAMQALKQRGIRLVLDDFGTAHSSFSYLLSFPFAQIKIDKSFVWALGTDASARAIVEAVLGMARAMRLDVVAEGVETPEQFDWVRQMGCGFVQGYLTGGPGPAQEARNCLAGIGRAPAALFTRAAPARS